MPRASALLTTTSAHLTVAFSGHGTAEGRLPGPTVGLEAAKRPHAPRAAGPLADTSVWALALHLREMGLERDRFMDFLFLTYTYFFNFDF